MKFLSLRSFSIVKYTKFHWPRPVPTLESISFKFNGHDYLVVLIISWKFEENRLKIDEVMNTERDEKWKKEKNKKRQNENRKVSD